jgi:hypothetical protein
MASRTSTIVQAEKGALLHTNLSSKAQLIAVNAISNTSTVNPKLSLLVHTSAEAPLNYEQTEYTVNLQTRTVDIDIPNEGATVVDNTQNSRSYMGIGGVPFATSGNQWNIRYQAYDPWMLQKPTEYGNPTENQCVFMHNYANQANLIKNVFATKANWASYFQNNGNNSDRDIARNLNYYSQGVVFDHYTNAFLSYENNNYSTAGMFMIAGNTASDGNRTTDSMHYYASGNSPNASYLSQAITEPALTADGGLIVASGRRNASTDYVAMFPFGRGEWGGTLPGDKTTMATTSNGSQYLATPANFTDTNRATWMAVPTKSFQWMKYNKATDRYYFCLSTGTGDEAGIWEVEWGKFCSSQTTSWGDEGSGPVSQSLSSPGVSQFSKWKQVASYPAVTATMSIPAKIGSSLWVSYDSANTAFFSTDLKTWQSASAFLQDGYVFQANTAEGKKYFVKSGGSVIQVVSGFAAIAQDGLFEKETEIGNYTRNGLILNPGDSVYAENLDQAADISITITEVAI